VVGYSPLVGGSSHGDVAFFDSPTAGKHAYVGTWSTPCSGGGVKIVDVRDPERPRVVATAGGFPGSSSEDVAVQRIGDRDVLAVGVQQCATNGVNGVASVDVTIPSRPKTLSLLGGPNRSVHELDLVVCEEDGRARALLAAPFDGVQRHVLRHQLRRRVPNRGCDGAHRAGGDRRLGRDRRFVAADHRRQRRGRQHRLQGREIGGFSAQPSTEATA